MLFAGAPWIAGKFKASGETVYLVSEKAAASRTLLPAKSVVPANAHAKVKSVISCFFCVIVMSLVRWYGL